MKSIKHLLLFTVVVTILAGLYYVYVLTNHPRIPENESFWTEVGEAFGEFGLFGLILIYGRSMLKLLLGEGRIAQRLLPDYNLKLDFQPINSLLNLLNHTHSYVGVVTVAVLLLHIAMMGIPRNILFFPAILALVIWQGLFGLFLHWKFTPTELKKVSYLVHAQFITGVLIGVFALFGHALLDD